MWNKAKVAIGFVVGLGLIYFLFRGTNWREVGAAIKGVQLGWFAVAQVFIVLSLFLRVQRWSYIVRAAKKVSFRAMFSATQIGFLANFTLPARIGEVIRAVVLARLAQLPFTKCFAMVALDRVTDLFGLVAVMLVALFAFVPPEIMSIPAETFSTDGPVVLPGRDVTIAEYVAIFVLVAVVGALVLLYVSKALALRISDRVAGMISEKLAAKLHDALEHFADGLHIFRCPTDMAKSIVFSLLTWGCFVASGWASLWAFHMQFPWYAPFVMQALLAVAVSVPGAPGFVGQFHIPIVLSIVTLVPDATPDEAKAVAIVVHLINLFWVALIGVYCLFREQMGFARLAEEGALARERIE